MITSESHGQVAAAAALLRAGGVVAFPTETVYGLGAEISNPTAVDRIFEIKKRPADHPLIVHLADMSHLHRWAQDIPEQAWRLAEHFWPGPLTLILPRSAEVPEIVTGGQDTVGLRIPDHPVALALLDALGPEGALAAPSANRFGRISPTTAAHVSEELGDAVDMILDGGPCRVGLESTIVAFEGQTPVILRPGGVSLAALAEVVNGKIIISEGGERTPRVPGSLSSHYAPATPLELWRSDDIWRGAIELRAKGLRVAVIGWSDQHFPSNIPEDEKIIFFSMPAEPEGYGRRLYATLRQFDHQRFDRLLIETPPGESAWMAISDRLQRASCISNLKLPVDGIPTQGDKNPENEATYG